MTTHLSPYYYRGFSVIDVCVPSFSFAAADFFCASLHGNITSQLLHNRRFRTFRRSTTLSTRFSLAEHSNLLGSNSQQPCREQFLAATLSGSDSHSSYKSKNKRLGASAARPQNGVGANQCVQSKGQGSVQQRRSREANSCRETEGLPGGLPENKSEVSLVFFLKLAACTQLSRTRYILSHSVTIYSACIATVMQCFQYSYVCVYFFP